MSGRIVATTVATIVFRWHFYSGSEYRGSNHTSVQLAIPTSLSLDPGEAAYLEMTYMNPDNVNSITFFFNNVDYPSRLLVPANFFSSQLTIAYLNPTVALGETVHIQGRLANSWNGSGIGGRVVELTARQFPSPQQSFALGNVITSGTGDYAYDWSPTLVGQFGIFASWRGDHFFRANYTENNYALYVTINRARSHLTIQPSISSVYPGISVTIRGVLTGLSGPIEGANIVISFRVPGTDTWTVLTSAATNSVGEYQAVWLPQATGNFTLKASWTGGDRQGPGEASATLVSSTPEGSAAFWVGSTANVTNLSIDRQARTVTFRLSNLGGAGSKVVLYLPKSFSNSIPTGSLKVNGRQVEYNAQEATTAWIVSFNFPNGLSNADVTFGPLTTTSAAPNLSRYSGFLLPLGIGLGAVLATSLVLLLKRRKGQ